MTKKVKDPKRVKAGKRARTKGSRFELVAAKLLSEIIFEDGDILKRTPRSGAAFIFGDCYYPPNPHKFILLIECKKEEGWEMHHVFSKDSIIWKWWNQAVSEVENALKITSEKRIPIVVFSKNNYPIFVLGSAEILDYFDIKEAIYLKKGEDVNFVIAPLNKENIKWQKQHILKELGQLSKKSNQEK